MRDSPPELARLFPGRTSRATVRSRLAAEADKRSRRQRLLHQQLQRRNSCRDCNLEEVFSALICLICILPTFFCKNSEFEYAPPLEVKTMRLRCSWSWSCCRCLLVHAHW